MVCWSLWFGRWLNESRLYTVQAAQMGKRRRLECFIALHPIPERAGRFGKARQAEIVARFFVPVYGKAVANLRPVVFHDVPSPVRTRQEQLNERLGVGVVHAAAPSGKACLQLWWQQRCAVQVGPRGNTKHNSPSA